MCSWIPPSVQQVHDFSFLGCRCLLSGKFQQSYSNVVLSCRLLYWPVCIFRVLISFINLRSFHCRTDWPTLLFECGSLSQKSPSNPMLNCRFLRIVPFTIVRHFAHFSLLYRSNGLTEIVSLNAVPFRQAHSNRVRNSGMLTIALCQGCL